MAYIGRQLVRGQNRIYDDISSSFNGSTTAFNLTIGGDATPPAQVNQLWIVLGGILQKPGTDFTIADAQVTFTTAPASGLDFWAMIQGDTSDMNAPSDGSVTPTKIATSGDFAFPADIRLKDADGSHYVGVQAPTTVSSNLVWTLPAADGSANQYLKTDGSGTLSWASDTATDATKMPLAGGTFTGDVTFTGDSANVTWDKSEDDLIFADDARAKFGSGGDLHVYHNGTNSVIREEGTGNLNIQTTGGNIEILTNTTENSAKFISNGAVELYYDSTKHFETTSAGCKVSTGHLDLDDSQNIRLGNSQDFLIYHNGSNSIINDNGTGNLELVTNGTKITLQGGSDTMANFIKDGAVELYYDNAKKLSTRTDGIEVHAAEAGNAEFRLVADEGDDGADYWRFQSNASTNNLNIASYASGSWADKVSLDTNGNIGVNTTSPSSWNSDADNLVINSSGNAGITINTGSAGSTSEGNIVFAEGTAGSADKFRGAIRYEHGEDALRFYTNNTQHFTIYGNGDLEVQSGSIKLTESGQGINFHAHGSGSSVSSNVLDDYEEGTFTVTVGGWDTYTPYTGSNYDYAWYIKVGGMVYFGWKVYIQGLATVSTNAHIRFSGLPFTSKDVTSGPVGQVRFDIPEFGTENYVWNYLGATDSTVYMYSQASGSGSSSAINATANRSNAWTMAFGVYRTDS